MSEVVFRIASDPGDFNSGLNSAGKGIDQLSAKTDAFANETKATFTSATKEVSDLEKQFIKGAKGVGDFVKETNKVGNSANAVKELKKQIKEFTAEAFKAGKGSQAFTENLAKAGKLKDELNDLNAQVKALSGNIGENLAKASASGLGLVARGFEGVTSVSILAGEKNKEFEETLLRLQAFNGLANVAGEFAGIGDKITEIKEGFRPVTDLFKSGASSIVDGYGSANDSLKTFFGDFKGNAKAALTSGIGFIKDFGKNAASVAKSAGTGFVSFFSNFGSNMKGFASAAKSGINTVGTAIKANPLGVILTVITLVIAAFVLLKDKVKPIAAIFEGIGKLIDEISAKIEQLGQALNLVATDAEKNREKLITGTNKAVQALEHQYDNEIKLANAAGKNTIELEKAKARATTKRITDTMAALMVKFDAEKTLTKEEFELYAKLEQQKKDIQVDVTAAILQDEREKLQKKKDLDKKAADLAKAAADKRKQLEKELSDALLDLQKKSEAAELNGLTGKAKLDKQRELNERDLQLLRDVIQKKGELTDKNFKFNAEQEREFSNIKEQINRDYYNGVLQLAIQEATKEAQVSKLRVDNEVANLDLKNTIIKNGINSVQALESASDSEKLIVEEQRNKLLLKQDLQFTKDKLALTIQEIQAEESIKTNALNAELELVKTKDDAISKARAEAIKRELGDIATNSALQVQAAQTTADNLIDSISRELNKGNKKVKINFGKLLQLDDQEIATALNVKFNAKVNASDVSNAKAALQQVAQSLKEILSAYFEEEQKKLDVELLNNEKRIEARNANIDSLKSALESEQSLRADGLANNVESIEQAIKSQEAARQKDLANEKRIKEEKKKLAKEQLIIDTITQASQLTLAIAQLYGALSGFVVGPVPVGLIIASAAAVGMVSSFAIQKSNAFEAVNKSGGDFWTGGYTGDGGKYEAKGTVHGGEFVTKKEDTSQNRNLLEGIHKDDKRLMEIGIRDLIKNKGISLESDINKDLSSTKTRIREAEANNYFINNNKGVENRIDALQEELKQLNKSQKDSDTTLPDGTRVIKRNNVTTVIRPKNG